MDRIEKNGVVYYAFTHIAQTGLARHGFSTKHGGASEGMFATMNLSISRGDDDARVIENLRSMTVALDMQDAQTVFCQQVHGTRIVHANAGMSNNGGKYPYAVMATDGLLANTNDIALATIHADCVPLFFLDPVKRAVAMTHAGWRGTVADIAGETVRKLQACCGSAPRDLLVGIGPSIGACCFEVGPEVADAFVSEQPFAADCVHRGIKKPHVDLWRVNERLLLRAGVLQANMETAGICTMCGKEDFYSHRRDGAARGSMAAFIQLV